MCGICGIVSLDNKPIDVSVIKNMADTVRHRGPDGEGFLLAHKESGAWQTSEEIANGNWQIALGHRRLSIIDLSNAGCQPMSYANGQYWIIHNGEIYNYLELRTELESMGYKFNSHTDTEVILAAYDKWGKECLGRFNGMWSFAILDTKNNQLFCARDRAGVKPFYYYFAPNGTHGKVFVFSSEIKQLFCHPSVKKSVNDGTLYDYLIYGLLDHSDQTLYKGIRQLRGAHYMIIPLHNNTSWTPAPIKYWDINLSNKLNNWSDAQYIERFKELFENSIRLRLRSDVPIGSCLSGGLDSSGIVSIVNKLLKEQGKTELQKTFSSCFDDPKYDERRYIEKVIEFTKVTPHYVFPKGERLLEELDKLIWHQDEPFGSTSIYAQWNVFRLAKENGVTVMLDGQGGDEILAGYPTYMGVYFIQLLKQARLLRLTKEMTGYYSLLGYSFGQAIKHMFSVYTQKGLYRLLGRTAQQKPDWLNEDFWQTGKEQSPFEKQSLKDSQPGSRLDKKLYELYFDTNMPALLHYEDRNSMAFSIESRVPFLDYNLVEFMFSTPADQKIRGGWAKYLYREAMKGLIPEEVRLRKDKMGFVTPEEIWMKATLKPYMEKVLSETKADDSIFDSTKLVKSFDDITNNKEQFSFTPWRWINTIIWRRML